MTDIVPPDGADRVIELEIQPQGELPTTMALMAHVPGATPLIYDWPGNHWTLAHPDEAEIATHLFENGDRNVFVRRNGTKVPVKVRKVWIPPE